MTYIQIHFLVQKLYPNAPNFFSVQFTVGCHSFSYGFMRRTGDMPLTEPIMASFIDTHMNVPVFSTRKTIYYVSSFPETAKAV